MVDDFTLQVSDLASGAVMARWSGPREQLFAHWSADGRYLSIGCYWGGGLWVYDIANKEASKVVDGSFAWCSWSDRHRHRMAIEKDYAQWHHEIWITNPPVHTPPAEQETQSTPGT
jgi:hypothetical protein